MRKVTLGRAASFVVAACLSCKSEGAPLPAPAAGTPSSSPPTAPPAPPFVRLTDVRFLATEQGPRIVVRGEDPSEAVERLHVTFTDDHGDALAIDLDGDGQPDPMELDVDVQERDARGFYVRVDGAPGVERYARQVTVTPGGGMVEHASPTTAVLAALPRRQIGEACSADGLDGCDDGAACAPGVVSLPNRCVAAADLRAARCADAPRVAIGEQRVLDVRSVGVWEPLVGCIAPEGHGNPDAAVWLEVPVQTARIVLRVRGEGAVVDSVVGVVRGCGASDEWLGCNDDGTEAPNAELVVTDVAPGRYLVVVDTLRRRGGRVVLEVSAP